MLRVLDAGPIDAGTTYTGPAFGTLQWTNPRDGVLSWCGWLYGDCGSAMLGRMRVSAARTPASCRARWSAVAVLLVTLRPEAVCALRAARSSNSWPMLVVDQLE